MFAASTQRWRIRFATEYIQRKLFFDCRTKENTLSEDPIFLIRNARFNGFNGIVAHFDDIRFVYSKAQSGLPLGVVV